MRYIPLLILFFLIFFKGFSQEEILLHGQIKADSLDESLIHVINLTQKTGTVNSASGEFNIRVKKQDTLKFSSVQYDSVEVIISAEIFQKKFLEVLLQEKLNELDEVKVTDINLTGNLETDLKGIAVFSQAEQGFPYSSRPQRSLVGRKIYAASSSPLFLLINTLNGRLKMLKKAEELMKFDEMVDRGVNSVPTEFFTEELGIPENEILNFVYFCAEKPQFRELLARERHLDLIEFYFENAKVFLNPEKD